MTDHSLMKLGKLPPVADSRRLQLARFLPSSLPAPPDHIDQTGGFTKWGMLANDRLGDCTIAGIAHAAQLYTHRGWGDITVTDEEVIKYYSKWCGYNPADPNSDQGGVEPDVLNQWRKEGFNGHKLLAYADPLPQNINHVKQAIAVFGVIYIGLALPISAQNQSVWDAVGGLDGEPGSWGGHCVIVPKYQLVKGHTNLTCITWGEEKVMTEAFWRKYCDEAHVLFHNGWYPKSFDRAGLDAALQAVSS